MRSRRPNDREVEIFMFAFEYPRGFDSSSSLVEDLKFQLQPRTPQAYESDYA